MAGLPVPEAALHQIKRHWMDGFKSALQISCTQQVRRNPVRLLTLHGAPCIDAERTLIPDEGLIVSRQHATCTMDTMCIAGLSAAVILTRTELKNEKQLKSYAPCRRPTGSSYRCAKRSWRARAPHAPAAPTRRRSPTSRPTAQTRRTARRQTRAVRRASTPPY